MGRWEIWACYEHMNGVRLSFGYYYIYSIHSVCIHETSCIPMNCIYSAHLLSKFLEELGVWIQNLQKWPTDGVIKLLRWELGQMMWSMWYRPVQVLDDERLYFDRDSLKWRSGVASPYITKHHLISKGFHFCHFSNLGLEHVFEKFAMAFLRVLADHPKGSPPWILYPLLFQSNLSGNPVIHQAVLPDFSVADWGDKTQLLQEFIQQWDHVLPSCLVPKFFGALNTGKPHRYDFAWPPPSFQTEIAQSFGDAGFWGVGWCEVSLLMRFS